MLVITPEYSSAKRLALHCSMQKPPLSSTVLQYPNNTIRMDVHTRKHGKNKHINNNKLKSDTTA